MNTETNDNTGAYGAAPCSLFRLFDINGKIWWVDLVTITRIEPPKNGQGFGSKIVTSDAAEILMEEDPDDCALVLGFIPYRDSKENSIN